MIVELSKCGRDRTFRICASVSDDSPANNDASSLHQNGGLHELRIAIDEYLSSGRAPPEGPLSVNALRKIGRDDLIAAILSAGGSVFVSNELGLPMELFTPPLQPVESKTFPDFIQVDDELSLTLGKDLDERLSTIDKLPSSSGRTVPLSPRTDLTIVQVDVLTAKELRDYNDSISPAIVDEVVSPGERLTLTTSMRVGLLLTTLSSALAYGKASAGVVDANVVAALKPTSAGLVLAHVILACYAAISLAPSRNRSSYVWFIKVLLSGPLGLRALRALEPLDSKQ